MSPTRKRLVFISSIAAPHQIKFCNALQDYFEARSWFYEYPDRTRGAWWRIDLGKNCRVLDRVFTVRIWPLRERYFAVGLRHELEKFDPDIVMVGGFSIPSNYLAYRWAKKRGKRTIVFTERSRDAAGALRRRSLVWRVLRRMYKDVDAVLVSADDAVKQFRDEFGFGDKVVASRYAADLDDYFHHPARNEKAAYTYLFANRMISEYNPVGAIDIFAAVLGRQPGSKLLMNAAGEMRDECLQRIAELGITDSVEFLSEIRSWSDLPRVYAESDILILPAFFSNGNFTILEAMASGMGVVISNKVLGVGKLIRDGYNGFRCEPTTSAFLNRIETYIRCPELFRVHGEINRKTVEPLSTRGTAEFFARTLKERFGI